MLLRLVVIRVRQDRFEAIIEISGRFTYETHSEFRSALDSLNGWSGGCLIDINAETCLDNAALSMLLLARERFHYIRIKCSSDVKRLLEAANVHHTIELVYEEE